MNRIILTATALCLAAPVAFAKGHDQGGTPVPGADDVGSVTVTSAQSLGGLVGKRPEGKGPKATNPARTRGGR